LLELSMTAISPEGDAMGLEVEIIKPAIGARIKLDRSMIGDPAVSEELKMLLDRHTVLVFPGTNLTDDEQLALTDAMGGRVNVAAAAGRSNAAEVYQVTLDKSSSVEPVYVKGTFFWHMDGLTVDLAPPKATVLSARRLSTRGGQTEFASTKAAYDGLPAEEKAELAGVRVLHSASAAVREIVAPEELSAAQRALTQEHPLILTQANGTKSLLIGATGDQVIGYGRAEGRSLLARLLDWTAQPAFSYRHYWQEGDCVVWDNTCALHRVIPYDKDSGRMMHRTVIAGTRELA
jgi:alpha-ketoglutarate-dependent taurine dioxygenase